MGIIRPIFTFGLMMALVGCAHVEMRKESSVVRMGVNVVPLPAIIRPGDGEFLLRPGTVVCAADTSQAALRIAQYLHDRLKEYPGLDLPVKAVRPAIPGGGSIIFTIGGEGDSVGEEGYTLRVSGESVAIGARKPAGLFYGAQTFLQLLPDRDARIIPAVSIRDFPRFRWRGMHLDVSRHFFPKEFIKKYIDLLALHKMNVFHWHLTDDNGWRIEIKKYPRLTEVGGWRVDRENQPWDGRKPPEPGEKATYGGFYTQDDIREIVEYAAERYVTVVPEIEMPGHSLAALAAYPEYSCTGGPFSVAPGGVDIGSNYVFCPGKESTFAFLDDVLTEVTDLFPSPFIHVGGDECTKERWKVCKDCQRRIKEEGLKDEFELQSYFIKRIERFLTSRGKRLVGWDEILEGGLAPQATVMSWRGIAGGTAAADEGHDVVMTPTSHCYFDYYQGDPRTEPLAIGGYTPLEKVYSFEPVPPELAADRASHILGAQGNIWTEFITTTDHVEYMAVPRMSALAEVLWSPKDARDFANFQERMIPLYRRFDRMGIHYRIPPPEGFDEQNVTLAKEAVLTLRSPIPNGSIVYTTDGTEPTIHSEVYTNPIALSLDTPLTVAAKVLLPDGRMSPALLGRFERQRLREPVTPSSVAAGVEFRYFEGSFVSTRSLDSTAPMRRGIQDTIGLPDGHRPENFGVELAGLIDVPSDGIYTFTLTSDDGSVMFVGADTVVDNDGFHSAVEKSGKIALKKGLQPFKVRFFQGGGVASLGMTWRKGADPAAGIPARNLQHQAG